MVAAAVALAMMVLPWPSRTDEPPEPSVRVRAAIDRILRSGVLGDTRVGLQVISMDTGEALFEDGAERLLLPASLTKLVVAVAARHRLSGQFRFRTELRTDGAREGDALSGNLYLRGGGDPSLNADRLAELARALAATGVQTITGDLVADESFFDARQQDDRRGEAAASNPLPPLSALSVDGNRLALTVSPGSMAGRAAELALAGGELPGFHLHNRAVTVEHGSTMRLQARVSGSSIIVSGDVPADSGDHELVGNVDDPVALALAVFRREADRAGLRILGNSRPGTCPPEARTLAEVLSEPLSEILRRILTLSDNFAAEMLLRTLGAVVYGAPGTRSTGLNAVQESLTSLGVVTTGATVHDGSGLSRRNRISARMLTDLLMAAARDPELQLDLIYALPEAGRDGTMADRFRDGTIPGVVLAKTGRLRGAVGMAGYFWTRDGAGRAFAILMNGFPEGLSEREVMDLQDKLVILLMLLEEPPNPPQGG